MLLFLLSVRSRGTLEKVPIDTNVFFSLARPRTTLKGFIFDSFLSSQGLNLATHLLKCFYGFVPKLLSKSLSNFGQFLHPVCQKFNNDPLHNGEMYFLLQHHNTQKRDDCVKRNGFEIHSRHLHLQRS